MKRLTRVIAFVSLAPLPFFASCTPSDPFFDENFVLAEERAGSWLLLSGRATLARFTLPRGATLEGVAPSLDVVVFNQIDGDVRRAGRVEFSLAIQPIGDLSQEILRTAVDFGRDEGIGFRRYHWLGEDGRSFILQFDSTLSYVQRAENGRFEAQSLLSNISDASGFDDAVAYLDQRMPQSLFWCQLKEGGLSDCSIVRLGESFNGVEVVGHRTAIVFRRSEDSKLQDFRLVDVGSGSVRRLSWPAKGAVFWLLPVPGTSVACFQMWQGGERFDGTRRTELGLWNWSTSEITEFSTGSGSQRVFRRGVHSSAY